MIIYGKMRIRKWCKSDSEIKIIIADMNRSFAIDLTGKLIESCFFLGISWISIFLRPAFLFHLGV